MSENAKPQASDGSAISTPGGMDGDNTTGAPKKTKSNQDTDKSSDIAGQIAAAIASKDFKAALALGKKSPEGIPAELMTQAQQGFEAQQGLAAATQNNGSAAPTPEGQQPQLLQQKEIAPPPTVEQRPKLNTTELEQEAVRNNPQIIEVGLKSGAAYAVMAEGAALMKVSGKGASMADAGKGIGAIAADLATEVGTELGKLVKQGSFGVLWNGAAEKLSTSSSNVVDLGGTGKFDAAGALPPPTMALADTNVIAANKDGPAVMGA